jgi:type IX secretion system PorP/SprF family membrane protein
MRKVIIIFIVLMPAVLFGQQFPFMEGYHVNPFSLSPAYAGIHNSKTLFIDYRSDWSGLEGGPTTYQLSYNDRFKKKEGLGGKFIYDQSDIFRSNVGFGVRFIYDKTDIFKQTLILGTYTYEVKFAKVHKVNFGLSAGFYRNSIDFAKYYNDPDYIQDQALLNSQEKSKIKFATDISALYRYRNLEAGILFSNIMFGTAKYRNTDLTYKPLKNYSLHATYLIAAGNRLSVEPTVIIRGGQNIPVQLEIAPAVTWNNRFWGTALFSTGGIFGVGLGGEVYDGIILNYSYNFSSNVAINIFSSHQLTLGIRIFNLVTKKRFSPEH